MGAICVRAADPLDDAAFAIARSVSYPAHGIADLSGTDSARRRGSHGFGCTLPATRGCDCDPVCNALFCCRPVSAFSWREGQRINLDRCSSRFRCSAHCCEAGSQRAFSICDLSADWSCVLCSPATDHPPITATGERSETTLAWTLLTGFVVSSPLAVLNWQALEFTGWLSVLAIGVTFGAAQLMMIRGFANAPRGPTSTFKLFPDRIGSHLRLSGVRRCARHVDMAGHFDDRRLGHLFRASECRLGATRGRSRTKLSRWARVTGLLQSPSLKPTLSWR